MADILLLIKIDGADAETAQDLAMRLLASTKATKTALEAEGHQVRAKAAAPCERCHALVDVQLGTLCNACARDEAMDRGVQQIVEGGQPRVAQLQPAEAIF